MEKMDSGEIGAVILAAGKGTRMHSDLPKVLHQVHGRSMIEMVVKTAVSLVGRHVVVVIGHGGDLVRERVSQRFDVWFARQENLLGTADAVKSALPVIPEGVTDVLVLCGDVPLVRPDTLSDLILYHREKKNHVSLLAVQVEAPTGYGRIIMDENRHLLGIREEADASMAEKKINLINAGIYCINKEYLIHALDRIDRQNAQQEYYLTDIVGIAVASGKRAGCLTGSNADEVMGVNTPQDLDRVAGSAVGA